MSLVTDLVDALLFPNRDQHAIPVLDGPWSPNHGLDNATVVLDGLPQPDDCVVGADAALYLSCDDRILRLDASVATGAARPAGATSSHTDPGPAPQSESPPWARLPGPAGALWPLPQGGLLVAVSGLGVLRLDERGREQARLTEAAGMPLTCVTALAAGPGDTIHIAHGSREHAANDWKRDLMSARPASGCVLATTATLEAPRPVLDGLAWPAGLAWDPAQQNLWITESWTHTLRRWSPRDGRSDVVQPNLPGYPGRVRRDDRGELWLALFALRTQLVEFVLRETAYREAMLARVPESLWVSPSLRANVDYREAIQLGAVKKLGIQKAWAPPRSYGLIARLSERGEVRASWHSRADGGCHGVTSVCPLADGHDVLAVAKGHGLLACIDTAAPRRRTR